MSASSDSFTSVIGQIRFVGRTEGAFKALPGFKKSHHTVPDAVNPATQAFLAKLCADELAAEAEQFFQRARSAFGYKRKDASLDVTSPDATLTTRNFTLEISYALTETDPSSYTITRRLSGVSSGDFLRASETDTYFAGLFSDLAFVLKKGASVEAVIDAVESLEGAPEERLGVDYPSDCRVCTLRVPGVDAQVVFDGAELSMVFPRKGSPRALIDAFLSVREAFALTKNKALAGLFR